MRNIDVLTIFDYKKLIIIIKRLFTYDKINPKQILYIRYNEIFVGNVEKIYLPLILAIKYN